MQQQRPNAAKNKINKFIKKQLPLKVAQGFEITFLESLTYCKHSINYFYSIIIINSDLSYMMCSWNKPDVLLHME